MWLTFLIAFGALVVVGALLTGWGFLLAFLLGLLFLGVAGFFVLQRSRGEPRTDRYHARSPSEPRDPSEAAASETPSAQP